MLFPWRLPATHAYTTFERSTKNVGNSMTSRGLSIALSASVRVFCHTSYSLVHCSSVSLNCRIAFATGDISLNIYCSGANHFYLVLFCVLKAYRRNVRFRVSAQKMKIPFCSKAAIGIRLNHRLSTESVPVKHANAGVT